jgi:hypothetical protein
MSILLSWMILAGGPPSAPPSWYQRIVTVPAAATNPTFWDTPIEVCGQVVPSSGPPTEAMMTGAGEWLSVDVSERTPLEVGASVCLTGVIRRRDGLSYEEAKARNLAVGKPSHAADPDVVLRLCSDKTSCDSLLPQARNADESGTPPE